MAVLGWAARHSTHRTGDVVGAQTLTPKGAISPKATVTPDPLLAQQVVHYGHGAGRRRRAGQQRSGTAITWRSELLRVLRRLSLPATRAPGSNMPSPATTWATTMEAAGINTHIYVDGSLRTGPRVSSPAPGPRRSARRWPTANWSAGARPGLP